MSAAAEILTRASELVAGERAAQHGDKAEGWGAIAAHWNAYLTTRRPGPLKAADVGHMMALLKIARTQHGEVNEDDWIDAAGYLACAAEIETGRF